MTQAAMQNQYRAVVKQSGDWWIGWREEVPGVDRQKGSREESLETLGITLREALEFNRADALRDAGPDDIEQRIAA